MRQAEQEEANKTLSSEFFLSSAKTHSFDILSHTCTVKYIRELLNVLVANGEGKNLSPHEIMEKMNLPCVAIVFHDSLSSWARWVVERALTICKFHSIQPLQKLEKCFV